MTPLRRDLDGLTVAPRLDWLQSLYQLTSLLTHTTARETVFAAALDALEHALGADRASVLLFDGAGVMRFVAWRGISAGYRQAVEGHSPWQVGERNPVPFGIADATRDTSLGRYRDTILGEGIRALAFVPLLAQDRLVGKFMLYQDQPREFTAEELRFAQTVGSHIAFAVERQRSEDARRSSEERNRVIVETAAEGICILDEASRVVFANGRMADLVGRPVVELHGRPITDFLCAEAWRQAEARLAAGDRQPIHQHECHLRRADGSEAWGLLTSHQLRDASGRPTGALVMVMDITERRALQEQLLAAQKLESIGRLAGGVAHDFNNLLTAILGFAEFAQDRLPAEHPARQDVQQISRAADRAMELTRQLLAFARRQVVELRPTSVADVVRSLVRMLSRLLGENIDLVQRVTPDLWLVTADAAQLEQVLLNLAVNARDALPDGGTMVLEARNVTLTAEQARARGELRAGDHVLLSVQDDGVGMSDAVRAHVFEPFFTTKEVGRGTGLGLATCYGIIKQCGGHIDVDSAPGKGTTFRIWLPRSSATAATPAHAATVLVAEDEETVRAMVAKALGNAGFHVLSAANGADAARMAEAFGAPIQLLITDVVMPRMGGRELAERLLSQRPGLRLLFVSGYADEGAPQVGGRPAPFLSKPFTPSALLARVRELLQASAPA